MFKISVCRYSQNSTCNFNGLSECSDNQCKCKQENEGELCEFCKSSNETLCLLTNNLLIEGEVDPITGEGVVCSCKY